MVKLRKDIKLIAIDKLLEYEKNNKVHTEEQISLLVQIIDKFGFTTPLLIDKKKNIIAGHGRKKAAERLGMKELPCLIINDLSDNEIRALRIADNRVAELAETHLEYLEEEWTFLKEDNSGLEYLTGYEEKDLISYIEEPTILDNLDIDSNESFQLILTFDSSKKMEDYLTINRTGFDTENIKYNIRV